MSWRGIIPAWIAMTLAVGALAACVPISPSALSVATSLTASSSRTGWPQVTLGN